MLCEAMLIILLYCLHIIKQPSILALSMSDLLITWLSSFNWDKFKST